MSTEPLEYHRCQENWYKDVEIRFRMVNQDQESWVPDQDWHATKLDVADGLASREGELICSHALLITHCPFCGVHLTAATSCSTGSLMHIKQGT